MRSRKTFFTKGCHSDALASLFVFLFYADRNPVLRVSAVTGQQHVASFSDQISKPDRFCHRYDLKYFVSNELEKFL